MDKQKELIKMDKLQEIIKLAYLANQKGPKQVWVSFAGHVNSVDVRIAIFDDALVKFVDEELNTTVYLTTSELDADDNIIRHLSAIIEKLHEKVGDL